MGAIRNKFDEYSKWGSNKFSAMYKILCSINGGADGLQTHLGEIRGKTGDAIEELEEQIQNCTKVLDNSLVAVISPQGISSNVVGDDPINTGGNVIEGTGVSFVKIEDGFGIGEGYTNLRTTLSYSSWNSPVTYTGNKASYTKYIASASHAISRVTYKANTTYTISGKFGKNIINPANLRIDWSGYTTIKNTINQDGTFELIFTVGETDITRYLEFLSDPLFEDTICEIEDFIITETGNKVPFVPYSFKGGNTFIDGNFSTGDYSFIGIGFKKNLSSSVMGFYQMGSTKSERIWCNSATDNDKEYDFLISKSYKGCFEGENEYGVSHADLEKSEGKIDIGRTEYRARSAREYKAFLVLKGNKTKEEMRTIKEIIKSNYYQLPPSMQGTIFPISDMVCRGDKYGIVEEVKKITDHSRELWYAADEGLYEFVNGETRSPVYFDEVSIDDPESPFEDISGRIRVKTTKQLPAYVRKVR